MKTSFLKNPILLCLFFTLFLAEAFAQNYHVSPGGSNSNDGSFAKPLQTIEEAAKRVQAGGTVFIMNGTYNRTSYGSVLEMKKSGTANAYITFKAYPGHYPKITASGSVWDAVILDGSYLIFEGIELAGNNANLTLANAKKAFEDNVAGLIPPNAAYNTNAMSIGKNQIAHHIIIRNCKVHDFPGGGIGASKVDYLTIEGNTSYNNSWYTMYATSGISVFGPNPIDEVTTHKIIIRNNICYGNKTQVKWKAGSGNYRLSDGNGIIIDANNGTQGKPVYKGRTLVENNVCYNNGGGGVHAFQAARVDIRNNTAYNNGTIVGYPEIDGEAGADVKIYNNIMYARTGGNCNGNDAGATYNYNLYFNGPAYRKGPNDVVDNPEFVKLALDGSADFRLKNTSPAINTGSTIAGQYSSKDILGVSRPIGTRSDRGAYEFQGTATPAPTVNNLYTDALASDWSNWSWRSAVNFASASPVKVGSKAAKVTFTTTYGGFSLRKGTAVSSTNLGSVKFWVYSATAITMTLQTQSEDNASESTAVPFTTTAGAWKEITVTRAQLGNPTAIKRMNFNAGNFTGDVSFDEICLVSSSGISRIAQEGDNAEEAALAADEADYTVYPNPVANEVHVKITASKGENIFASLVSLQGTELTKVKTAAEQTGVNIIIINTRTIKGGAYLIRYGTEKKVKSSHIVVEK